MQKRIMMPLAIVMTMLMATMSVVSVAAIHEDDGATHEFANEDFEATWNRTDLPVEAGEVSRTWIWGPAYTDGMMEPYAESPENMREVQYFDKSRMEINNPDAFNDGLWYVTNGLLVVEMVEGWYQEGDAEFNESPDPAEVNVTGDPGDETGMSPTYADINTYGLRDEPARADGEVITHTIDADGNMGSDETKAEYDVTAAYRVQEPTIDHQVASVFWDFMNSTGTVYEDGAYVVEPLFESPFYATGLPITEAYWSSVMVNGSERDVLWQCFERRCLTYTPGNPEGFLVEAGNVGQHYYRWRYGDTEPEPETMEYEVQFGSLNGSGVMGTVLISLTGDELTLDVQLSGLEPGDHAWHIHGFGDGTDAMCPTMDLDENENGFIELEEGGAAYGPVIVPLGTLTADNDGVVDTTVTVTLDDEQLNGLGEMLDNVFVVHGMTADLDGEGDGEAEFVPLLPVACGDVNEPGFDDGAEVYEVAFEELNESGVSGTVQLTLINDLLKVTVDLSGLEADQIHPMHLHGFSDGTDAMCPTDDLDTDENGYVDLAEGVPAYGPVIVPFGAPMADENGDLMFSGSFIVDTTMLGNLMDNVVVVHGLTADLDGEGDGEAEYVATLPVGCADINEPDVEAPEVYTVALDELNESDVSGAVMLSLDGDQLTVMVQASGLEADMEHPMHIHGLEDGNATCPTMDLDTNDDGYVDLEEGLPAYGGVLYTIGAPMADADGNLMFETTLTVDPETLMPLEDLVVVVHGLTVDLDGEGGDDAEYVATMPVACGEFELAEMQATAEIMDADGEMVGTAHMTETGAGVLVYVEVMDGVEPGLHGVHIHETGICTPEDFTSAGGHFNPMATMHPDHAGDLGNMLVGEDGTGTLMLLTADITLGEGDASLFDADLSALVIHSGEDDMVTDPSGNSGSRIACGVITAAGDTP